MKKALLGILLVGLAVGLVGCNDYDTQPLEFVNASSFTVVITSLSIEWTGFVLQPGEKRKMEGIRDVDFTFYPDTRVQEGFATTDRYIVFVNIDTDGGT
jgi:hypothetical protein